MSDLIEFIEEEIGAMLRAAREDLGMSRAEVAARLGISEKVIEDIEYHRITASLSLLQRYAEVVDKRIQVKFL